MSRIYVHLYFHHITSLLFETKVTTSCLIDKQLVVTIVSKSNEVIFIITIIIIITIIKMMMNEQTKINLLISNELETFNLSI